MKKKRNEDLPTEDIFEIDETNLDEEWIRQPKLMFRFARLQAEAQDAHNRAESNLKLVVADLDVAIRSRPKRYGLEKTTEPSIKAAILSQPEYEQANDRVLRTKHRADVFGAAVRAIEHRKKALEKLVDLWTQSYFSEPKSKGDYGEEAVKRSVHKRAIKHKERR